MNTIDTNQLLGQLRAAAAQASSRPAEAASAAEQTGGASFSSLLTQSIDKVNDMQMDSKHLKEAFQVGDPNVSLPQVMVSSAKAGLAFDAMIQMRNKMVDAYQEVMRMSV